MQPTLSKRGEQMSGKRVLALYAAVLLGFAVVLCRLYFLAENHTYAARAEAQSTVRLCAACPAGQLLRPQRPALLTGLETRYLALCFPGENSYSRLYAYTDECRAGTFVPEPQPLRTVSAGSGPRPFRAAAVSLLCNGTAACVRSSAVPAADRISGWQKAMAAAGLEKALDKLADRDRGT